MRRWHVSLLLFILALTSLAQTASQLQTDAVTRIGSKLAC